METNIKYIYTDKKSQKSLSRLVCFFREQKCTSPRALRFLYVVDLEDILNLTTLHMYKYVFEFFNKFSKQRSAICFC
jgi:hypothetical protein